MTEAVVLPIVEEHFDKVRAGIRVFVRLFGLEADPIQAKYAAGEMDVLDSLDCVKMLMHGTKRFIGKQKHVGVTFDFVDDVKRDMAEMLLMDEDQAVTAVKRKRHLPLYHLVVDPIVELFRKYDHDTAIQNVDTVLDYITQTAFVEEDYGTYDDAIVAREQIRQIIREREEQTKLEAASRKRINRKVAKRLEAELNESLDVASAE